MTIRIGLWIVPLILTLVFAAFMFRPYQRQGDYDFGQIFRVLWIIPTLLVWCIYLGLTLIFKKP